VLAAQDAAAAPMYSSPFAKREEQDALPGESPLSHLVSKHVQKLDPSAGRQPCVFRPCCPYHLASFLKGLIVWFSVPSAAGEASANGAEEAEPSATREAEAAVAAPEQEGAPSTSGQGSPEDAEASSSGADPAGPPVGSGRGTAAPEEPWGQKLLQWAAQHELDMRGFYVVKPAAAGLGGRLGEYVIMLHGLPAAAAAAFSLLAQVCAWRTPAMPDTMPHVLHKPE
jgi:hypothetical protein